MKLAVPVYPEPLCNNWFSYCRTDYTCGLYHGDLIEAEYFIQPTNTTNYLIKVGAKLVGI